MIRIAALGLALAGLTASAEARPHRAAPSPVSQPTAHCIDGICPSAAPAAAGKPAAHSSTRGRRYVRADRSRRASPRASGVEIAVLGGRPAACYRFPKTARKWCGCAAALDVGLPNPTGYWNLASNWFGLPRAAPGYNMAAVRYGHVAILKRHIQGTIWLAYDPNSGGQLARLHPIDLRSYRAVVDPTRRRAEAPSPGPEVPRWGREAPSKPPEAAGMLAAAEALDDAREFLIRTAVAGGTMMRLGRDGAIGQLHPIFAVRLSAALGEARRVPGLEGAACSSAYRPPAFGIGGYRDKFDSNHAYGLACDLAGIGRPGSVEAKRWHAIATKHGLYNPYFDGERFAVMCGRRGCVPMTWEWNHYSPIPHVKAVAAAPALRKTITAHGPIDPVKMWRAADPLFADRRPVIIRTAARGRYRVASIRR